MIQPMRIPDYFVVFALFTLLFSGCAKIDSNAFKGPEFKHSAEVFTKRIQRADSVNFSYAHTIKSYFVGQSASSSLQFHVHYPAGTVFSQQQADWQLSELEKIARAEILNPDDFDVIRVYLTNGTDEITAEKEWSK